MKKGTTIWLTGLSGSGKTTLGQGIEKDLIEKGLQVQVLDGDIIRNEIGHLFGYSREERMKMAQVLRAMSNLLNKNGVNVIVAAITAYEEIRETNRENIDNYLEIFINCPVEKCIERDVKGLYKKALSGEVKNVIGIDEEFETPQNSDIEINTAEETIEESLRTIKDYMEVKMFNYEIR